LAIFRLCPYQTCRQHKNKSAYLNFIFGSTSSKSLNPIPHGFPGVASSMKRPNSGWNIGSVLGMFRHRIEAANLLTLTCQQPASLAHNHPRHRVCHRGREHGEYLLGVMKELLWGHYPCSQQPSIRSIGRLVTTQDSAMGELTSSPHRRASLCFPLARFQIASNCYDATFSIMLPYSAGYLYLYTPLPDMVCILLRLWPIERGSQGSEQTSVSACPLAIGSCRPLSQTGINSQEAHLAGISVLFLRAYDPI